MEHFNLNATVKCRKVNDGVRVTLTVRHDKSTHGASTYKAKFVNIGDVNHWAARIITELCSDVQGLSLESAMRALEVRHVLTKNLAWDMLRGCGYAIRLSEKPYYNSAVYTYITVYNLIKPTKG